MKVDWSSPFATFSGLNMLGFREGTQTITLKCDINPNPKKNESTTVDGSEILRLPAEVGSL